MARHPQSVKANERRFNEAQKRRLALLAKLPDQFTVKNARECWGMLDDASVRSQVALMRRHKLVAVVQAGRPQVYAKVV